MSTDAVAEPEVGRKDIYSNERNLANLFKLTASRNVKLTFEFQLSDVCHTEIAHATIAIGLASDSQANIPAKIL